MSKRKFWTGTAFGLIMGMGIATAGVAAADSQISAYLVNSMNFVFDGKQVDVPSDYSILGYQGHTYVPARFVAEQLGATVGWDPNTRTITFTKNSDQFNPTGDNSAPSSSNTNSGSSQGSSSSTSGDTGSTSGDTSSGSTSNAFQGSFTTDDGYLTVSNVSAQYVGPEKSDYKLTFTVKANFSSDKFFEGDLNAELLDKDGNYYGEIMHPIYIEGGQTKTESETVLIDMAHYQLNDSFDINNVAKVKWTD